MFRVDLRFSGQGLWSTAFLPVSLQAAVGQARALEGGRFADHARIVPTGPEQHLVDISV